MCIRERLSIANVVSIYGSSPRRWLDGGSVVPAMIEGFSIYGCRCGPLRGEIETAAIRKSYSQLVVKALGVS
jgi:hypothetical protein